MTSIPSSSSSSAANVDLDALFEASLAGYRNRTGKQTTLNKNKKQKNKERHFGADEDVIRLVDEDDDEENGDNDGEMGNSSGKRKRKRKRNTLSGSTSTPSTSSSTTPTTSRLNTSEITRHLTNLEQPISSPPSTSRSNTSTSTSTPSTAGSKWFDMPAFPSSSSTSGSGKTGHGDSSGRYISGSSSRGPTADEMRREVQAIRLRNALDPKRFYKGKGKGSDKGMPQFAQLGKIVGSSLEPNHTLTRAQRGNTVVEELVKDAQTAAYAKRKFAEHQHKTSAGGKGHYKAKTRKPSDRKRARK